MKSINNCLLIGLMSISLNINAEIVEKLECEVSDQVKLYEPSDKEIYIACKKDLETIQYKCVNNIIQYHFESVILIPVILNNEDNRHTYITPYSCSSYDV